MLLLKLNPDWTNPFFKTIEIESLPFDLKLIAESLETIDDSILDSDINLQIVLLKYKNQLEEGRRNLKESRTSSLWFTFMKMVDILKMLIRSLRLGDFNLYVKYLNN